MACVYIFVGFIALVNASLSWFTGLTSFPPLVCRGVPPMASTDGENTLESMAPMMIDVSKLVEIKPMDGYLEPIENEPLKIPWPKSQESFHALYGLIQSEGLGQLHSSPSVKVAQSQVAKRTPGLVKIPMVDVNKNANEKRGLKTKGTRFDSCRDYWMSLFSQMSR